MDVNKEDHLSKEDSKGRPVNSWISPTNTPGNTEAFSPGHRFRRFAIELSVEGLKYVADPNVFSLRRLLWLSLVLFGAGFAVYQIFLQTRSFLSYPTNVSINIVNNQSLQFPTVTICNENTNNRSAVEEFDPNVAEAFRLLYPPIAGLVEVNLTQVYNLLERHLDSNWTAIWPTFYLDPRLLIIKCTFNARPCDENSFQTLDTDVGRCIRFNYDGSYSTEQAGSASGLQLSMFVDNDNYLTPMSPTAGYMVSLHSQNENSWVLNGAFLASVNQQTQVQISTKKMHQMPPPYGNCFDKKDYVRNTCVHNCLNSYILEKCGCLGFSSQLMSYGPNATACSPLEVVKCFLPNYQDVLANDLLHKLCDCPQQCDGTIYPTTISAADLSEFSVDWVVDTFFSLNWTADYIRKEGVFLDIFYSNLEYEELSVHPAYTLTALLCDIGGALGLLLGSTVLTIFEIGDFLVVFLWQCAGKKKTKVGEHNYNNANPMRTL